MKSMKLSTEALQDAKKVAYGLYRMNEPYANRYGFNVAKGGKEVCYGMFLNNGESEKEFEYIIELKSGKVRKSSNIS